MHFIFPQNYNFKNKIFGFIDYTTAIVNVIWYLIIFGILKLFPFNNENIIYFVCYIFKFIKNRKIYFFNKF